MSQQNTNKQTPRPNVKPHGQRATAEEMARWALSVDISLKPPGWCSTCKNQLPDGAKFCIDCGAAVGEQPATGPTIRL